MLEFITGMPVYTRDHNRLQNTHVTMVNIHVTVVDIYVTMLDIRMTSDSQTLENCCTILK